MAASPLSLVALQTPAHAPQLRHHLGEIIQSVDADARAFACLVVRLPSDCIKGSVLIQHDGRNVACAGHRDAFQATYTVSYTDCDTWIACAAGGYSVFVVYALTATQVRLQICGHPRMFQCMRGEHALRGCYTRLAWRARKSKTCKVSAFATGCDCMLTCRVALPSCQAQPSPATAARR